MVPDSFWKDFGMAIRHTLSIQVMVAVLEPLVKVRARVSPALLETVRYPAE